MKDSSRHIKDILGPYGRVIIISAIFIVFVSTRVFQPVTSASIGHSLYEGEDDPVFHTGETIHIWTSFEFMHIWPLDHNKLGDTFWIEKLSFGGDWIVVYREDADMYHVHERAFRLSGGDEYIFDPADCLDSAHGGGYMCGPGSYRAMVDVCGVTHELPFTVATL